MCWPCLTLVHGDLKSDNILVVDADIKIVDWESVQWGDPAWDVASVFSDLALSWAGRYQTNPVEKSEQSLGQLHLAANSFWDSYARILRDADERRGVLRRALYCTVTRLVQSAYEMCLTVDEMPPLSALALQLGENLSKREHVVGSELFGITW